MKRLGEILVDRAWARPQDVDSALAARQPGERLGRALVRLGTASEENVSRALAIQFGLGFEPGPDLPVDPETLALLPAKLAVGRRFLPLVEDNGRLRVAVGDPLDVDLLDELEVLSHLQVEPVVAPPSVIEAGIKRYYGVGAEEIDRMLAGAREAVEVLAAAPEKMGEVAMAEDAALVKFVNQVLVEAVRERASDVHVEPLERELRVRYRIDGVLHVVPVPAQLKRFQPAIVSRIKIMSSLNIAEKRLPQDGRIRLKVLGREIDIRVSVIPNIHGEGVVLRLLDQENLRLNLADLGMPEPVVRPWSRLVEEPHGILLVTGPTGSGKTTTLYAALAKIAKPEEKVITIEDPVEYQLAGVQQIQVAPKIGLSFANGLRSILRHDPDIILVGEIRDLETAEITVQAALTGHLVLSTLHTNDAPSAITRLVDMGVEPYLVASTVEAVMAQRLVRRVCPECARQEPVDPVRAAVVPSDIRAERRGAGCGACRKTGYRGRTGLFELMPIDEELREMIVRRDPAARLKRHATKSGMRSLRQDGWDRVRAGVTTVEEVVRITKEDRA